MRITIINGEPVAASAFDGYVRQYADGLIDEGHGVTRLDLRDLDLKGCSGCWGCWVKTPGECVKRDESATVCRTVLASDLVVFASPVVMGYTNALVKRACDQLIPLVHPAIVVDGDELHHLARYERYPDLALLLDVGPGSDAEDIEITTAIWARTARNLKGRLVFVAVADRSPEEVAHELASVA